jgi:hypothetical protein
MTRRRYTLMIDVESSEFRNGVRFWSEALGATARHSGDPRDPFIELPAAAGDVHVEMQRINAHGRYHLDLYAHDVDREARRLEQLGAAKVKREEAWWVMRAPTGHLFCIIPDTSPAATEDDDLADDDLDEDDLLDDDEDIDDDFEDELDDDGDVDERADDRDDRDDERDDERRYPPLRAVPRPED